MGEYVVAVDLGGSLTKIAYADRSGTLTGLDRRRTELSDGGGLLGWLADQITEFARSQSGRACVGYGIVVPGIIDTATGTVKAAPNVGWYDVPLRDRLAELTGLSGAVGHDVRSGGLAEWRLGGGADVSNLLFMPLGTGIAAAMVVDGRMLDADGYAGEIGHIRVAAAGELSCACGQVGCLETVASASGVGRSYARLTGARELDGVARLDARIIADRARGGERAAQDAFALAAEALTEALMLYLTLLGPEKIIIGGGLVGAADLLVPWISRQIEARVAFQRVPRIVTATLGPNAGVIGAGLVGWDHVLQNRNPE